MRSGQIKNSESARVSMIGQVKPIEDNSKVKSPSVEHNLPSDTIAEEDEDDDQSSAKKCKSEVSRW